MKYFDYDTAAKRYAKGRPFFHPLVIQKIAQFTQVVQFDKAIDVCCGTGLSTVALKAIAHSIVGTDQSQEMMDHAPQDSSITYLCCPAEQLDVFHGSFDLMTVALGFHWLDRPRFMREAYRVLRESAWLVIYQNGFSGSMRDNAEYKRWNDERYLARYPTPARNHSPFTKVDAAAYGFDFNFSENYSNEVKFTVEELACYLSTQSNTIASIESGRESAEEAMAWLMSELGPMFRNERETFPFGGSIWYLNKLTAQKGALARS
ncbi:MAG: class I SAM-dependent methyltransferase [Verrucomicrobiales bacterium]